MALGQRERRSGQWRDLSLARSGHYSVITKVHHVHVFLSLVNLKIRAI